MKLNKTGLAMVLFLLNFAAWAQSTDIVIADFEGPNYGDWMTTGTAFGPGPAHGTFRNQNPVQGFLGRGYASSFYGGDRPAGTLTSPSFLIERNFIRFLIGGGNFRGVTCMNLLVDGQVVRLATGAGSERLFPRAWNVSEFAGRMAQIQIVDNGHGAWGHINVDEIVQGDVPRGVVIPMAGRPLPSAGFPANRYPPAGFPANRYPPPGYAANGYVPPAFPGNGYPPAGSRGLPTTTALAPGLSATLKLDEFSHALDVQLVDKLGGSKLFSVVEDKDLRAALYSANAGGEDSAELGHRKLAIVSVGAVPTLSSRYGLPPQSGPLYDLKNADMLARFKNAGIDFLLITTVEDMDENHIDGATVTRDFEEVNGQRTGWWVEDLSGSSDGDDFSIHGAGAQQTTSTWVRQTVHVSSMTQKEQSLRVTLRSRLFDTKTGELLGSKNKTYARGRSYMAAAQGNNELSMGDLYQTAAEDLADWERLVVEDQAFPAKIVKIDDAGVLINRGSDSGIVQNSYYSVWVVGELIKDPDSGEVLGREEKNVGKVFISELQSRFSRAKIDDDSGIKLGAILRPARY